MIFSKDYSHLLLIPEGKEGAIAIPGSTTNVPAQALSLCRSGSSLTTGDGGTEFVSHDRMLFSKDLKILVACPPAYGTAVVLPTETESIGEYALAGCKDLASITVLGNINSIDPTAFADEVKASAVVALPAGEGYGARKSIWENAGFQNFAEPATPGATTNPDTNNEATSGLTYTLLEDYTLAASWQGKDDPKADLEIPSSAEINNVPYRVSTIAENSFANRGSLTSVKLPSTITTINDAAFAGCANLAAIDFPNTLRTIGERAFEATSLKDVWLSASINSIGSRAFASCSTLERVVALGTPEVASDALAGCTNVSIYIPTGFEDTWNPGLPSDGNHLMPYGISLSEEPLTIEAGQEADLLEGGNLQAPEPIKASYSYAAAPLSVDAGRVSAKKAGTTNVIVVLSLNDVELTRASRTVEVSPNPEGEADIAMLNSEVPLPAAYLANARESQVNVTVPLRIIFGLATPYDVAEGKTPPASFQTVGSFSNNMDVPVQLAQITCIPQNIGDTLTTPAGVTPLMKQKLFSFYPAYPSSDKAKAIHFGCNQPINSVTPTEPRVFTIESGASRDFVFRLNLTNDTANLANAKVIYDIAGKKRTTHDLATVVCTFKAAPLLGFGSGDVSSSAFYLKDNNTGEVYTAAEVKAHANAIVSGNETIKAAYQAFMDNENTYECKTVWGGTPYDVRIIGINHDDKTSGGKAGITLQFVNLLDQKYSMNLKNENNGGWGACELRRKMNPGGDIWSIVPDDLQKEITQVSKAYGPDWGAYDDVVYYSQDYLFVASYRELSDSIRADDNYSKRKWLLAEGYQYEYWNGKVPNNYDLNPSLEKSTQSNPKVKVNWWERSPSPPGESFFFRVGNNGNPGLNYGAGELLGVCPCFCL